MPDCAKKIPTASDRRNECLTRRILFLIAFMGLAQAVPMIIACKDQISGVPRPLGIYRCEFCGSWLVSYPEFMVNCDTTK
jgi:hypothetical protein